SRYNNKTFRGLPPPIADSLPDLFGNMIFKEWLESSNKAFQQISIIEQLAYVSNRGMGALEYYPAKAIPKNTSINLTEIIAVLRQVMDQKRKTKGEQLNNEALLNIFKIGTSAGGARPKILISENKTTGAIIPGDLEYSGDYNHYLMKLSLKEDPAYSPELIEYTYYRVAQALQLRMMPSKLVNDRHFSTLRFDRQNGKKQHVLTACGITGWDFKDPAVSSYEGLFDLALFLKIPHREIEALYKRMVFNLVFSNIDDHLKNHSFIYNDATDQWNLAPAYDLTYPLDPRMNFTRMSRALSINNKRTDITLKDLLTLADEYTVKNPKGIISEVQGAIPYWSKSAMALGLPLKIVETIKKQFQYLV
ncbi:MAG: HipA domain-containing protein, partial [Bacteroidota bacterium]